MCQNEKYWVIQIKLGLLISNFVDVALRWLQIITSYSSKGIDKLWVLKRLCSGWKPSFIRFFHANSGFLKVAWSHFFVVVTKSFIIIFQFKSTIFLEHFAKKSVDKLWTRMTCPCLGKYKIPKNIEEEWLFYYNRINALYISCRGIVLHSSDRGKNMIYKVYIFVFCSLEALFVQQKVGRAGAGCWSKIGS